MDKKAFLELLDGDNRDYRNRLPIFSKVIHQPELIVVILDHMRNVTDKNSNFSARILELACKKDLTLILPYLDSFCELLPKLRQDGATRASVKIIELLMVENFLKFNPIFSESLQESHLEQFTECCFDYMITDRAIAIQAHSMYALYLLGTKYDWIHLELRENIHRNLQLTSSAGYQNRGKKIIDAILDTTGKMLKLY